MKRIGLLLIMLTLTMPIIAGRRYSPPRPSLTEDLFERPVPENVGASDHGSDVDSEEGSGEKGKSVKLLDDPHSQRELEEMIAAQKALASAKPFPDEDKAGKEKPVSGESEKRGTNRENLGALCTLPRSFQQGVVRHLKKPNETTDEPSDVKLTSILHSPIQPLDPLSDEDVAEDAVRGDFPASAVLSASKPKLSITPEELIAGQKRLKSTPPSQKKPENDPLLKKLASIRKGTQPTVRVHSAEPLPFGGSGQSAATPPVPTVPAKNTKQVVPTLPPPPPVPVQNKRAVPPVKKVEQRAVRSSSIASLSNSGASSDNDSEGERKVKGPAPVQPIIREDQLPSTDRWPELSAKVTQFLQTLYMQNGYYMVGGLAAFMLFVTALRQALLPAQQRDRHIVEDMLGLAQGGQLDVERFDDLAQDLTVVSQDDITSLRGLVQNDMAAAIDYMNKTVKSLEQQSIRGIKK